MSQYVIQRPNTANLHFRRAVPLHLRTSLKKREIVQSLHTADRREAERRAHVQVVETDALFAQHEALLRSVASFTPEQPAALPHTLTRWQIPTLVERYRTVLLDTEQGPSTLDELRELRADLA